MNVITIPAKPQKGNNAAKVEVKKLRVAAYCRVSTDNEEQATSYKAQIAHYREFISSNPDWVLVDVYADDGISATSTKGREQFNAMIEDCKRGLIDMILTKSISRFARNTVDCLNYIRMLKGMNIPVFFEKESINTMDAKGEVLLTIMASLAHQESESLSQNVKIGVQYRFQQGKVMVNARRFLGYDKDDEGHLIINPAEAEIVKRIFREYLEGASCQKIARGLERDGILTVRGSSRWHDSTIRKILENEKYMEDLQRELIDRTEPHENYDDLAEEILRLRELQEQKGMDDATQKEHTKRIRELQKFIQSQPKRLTFDDTLVKHLLAKITIFPEHLLFEFKSGVNITIEK